MRTCEITFVSSRPLISELPFSHLLVYSSVIVRPFLQRQYNQRILLCSPSTTLRTLWVACLTTKELNHNKHFFSVSYMKIKWLGFFLNDVVLDKFRIPPPPQSSFIDDPLSLSCPKIENDNLLDLHLVKEGLIDTTTSKDNCRMQSKQIRRS